MAFSPSHASFGSERAPGAGVTAVLGPTNTGKTHLAIERMLGCLLYTSDAADE